MTNVTNNNQYRDDIDLKMIWNVLWNGKYILIAMVILSAAGSVIYAISLPNVYRSYAILAAAPGLNQEAAGGIGSRLKGLAGIAGGAFGGQSEDKVGLAIEIINSRKFVREFAEKHDIIVDLMAGKVWDQATQKLIIDDDIYDVELKKWTREVKFPRTAKPADWEVYKKFREIVGLSQDLKTGFIVLSVDFLSPVLSQKWVAWIIEDINMIVREKDIAMADIRINYLEKKIEEIKSFDLKNSFFSLIKEESRNKMLAETRMEYVFNVIDPAIVPMVKFGPKRALICILGTLLGGIFGLVIISVRHSLRQAVD